MKVRLLVVCVLALVFSGCSDDDSPAASTTQDGSEVLGAMETAVTGAMSSGLPGVTGASAFAPRALADWTTAVAHLNRPGDGSSSNIARRQYVADVMNSDYEADGFSPTVFGRFRQELEVLDVVADQVTFSNGVPTVGTHSITTNIVIDDVSTEKTFNFVVAASSDADFDVTFAINETYLQYYGALRNTSSEVNFIGIEGGDDNSGGMSILFWNRSTGKLRYDFMAKQNSGPTIEFHRFLIEETGGSAYLAHIYKEGGDEHKMVLHAPEANQSTEISVSFEKNDTDGGDDLTAQAFCIDTSDSSATTNAACASAALPTGDLNSIITAFEGYANATALKEAVFGEDFSERDQAQLAYDAGSITNFLTNLSIQ